MSIVRIVQIFLIDMYYCGLVTAELPISHKSISLAPEHAHDNEATLKILGKEISLT